MKGFEPSTPGATVQCSNQIELHSPYSKFQAMLARQKGFEPLTYGLEGRCSIQLSYWREFSRQEAVCSRQERKKQALGPPTAYCLLIFWSGRDDLNVRPPAPKAGALPGCATPRQETEDHSTHAGCEIKDSSKHEAAKGGPA